MYTRRQLVAVEEGKIHLLNTYDNTKMTMDADCVVLSLGVRPQVNEFVGDVEKNFKNVRILGDSQRQEKFMTQYKQVSTRHIH